MSGAVVVVDVAFTVRRPVVPDERTHRLVLALDNDGDDPQLFAAQWLAARPGVVMPTRTTVVSATI
jgi:hypothetical protein